jgi:hypothetical protein
VTSLAARRWPTSTERMLLENCPVPALDGEGAEGNRRAVVGLKHALDRVVVVGNVSVHEHPGRVSTVRDDLAQDLTIGDLEGSGVRRVEAA